MTKTSNTGFYIYDFMIEKLGLTGIPLLVYALIYSFSRTGNDCHGSIGYIAERVGAGEASVKRALKQLTDSALIIKHSDPHLRTKIYRANLAIALGKDNELSQIDPPGTDLIGDINYNFEESKMSYNNKEIIKTTTTSTTDASQKKEDLEFLKFGYDEIVWLTMEQYLDLKNKLGKETLDYYIMRVQDCLLVHPDVFIKNHYRTILKWAREDAAIE